MNIILIIPISNEKYKDGGVMGECVFDITLKIRSQRKVMTKTQINTFAGGYVVKVRVLKAGTNFFINNYIWMKGRIF